MVEFKSKDFFSILNQTRLLHEQGRISSDAFQSAAYTLSGHFIASSLNERLDAYMKQSLEPSIIKHFHNLY